MSSQYESGESFLPTTDYSQFKPHGNSKHILQARRLKPEYARDLQRALKTGTEHIAGYFSWAIGAESWNTKKSLFWIQAQLREPLPSEHFAFYLGSELVGIGSLRPHGHYRSVQMAYWVSNKIKGQGIGKTIAKTMENLAIRHRPYQYIYIDHDSSNRSSAKIPQKLGYKFVGTFESEIHARKETGLWYSHVKESPRYRECQNEKMMDLRFVDLWCRMMLEMHPEIYKNEYAENHALALKEYEIEQENVRSKNEVGVA
jgi:RimJ/RimL family protein N-acetyltransferase